MDKNLKLPGETKPETLKRTYINNPKTSIFMFNRQLNRGYGILHYDSKTESNKGETEGREVIFIPHVFDPYLTVPTDPSGRPLLPHFNESIALRETRGLTDDKLIKLITDLLVKDDPFLEIFDSALNTKTVMHERTAIPADPKIPKNLKFTAVIRGPSKEGKTELTATIAKQGFDGVGVGNIDIYDELDSRTRTFQIRVKVQRIKETAFIPKGTDINSIRHLIELIRKALPYNEITIFDSGGFTTNPSKVRASPTVHDWFCTGFFDIVVFTDPSTANVKVLTQQNPGLMLSTFRRGIHVEQNAHTDTSKVAMELVQRLRDETIQEYLWETRILFALTMLDTIKSENENYAALITFITNITTQLIKRYPSNNIFYSVLISTLRTTASLNITPPMNIT